jgi:3-deoxy-manno-octulosonate cytidylyltransferase (CMP-KDO synthetase)
MRIIGVIPARFHSTRLQGKPLADIHGKPMIWHVYECARRASRLERVLVATDDERIRAVVEGFGGSAIMTSAAAASGTDRVAEAVGQCDADVIVNLQGDEPLLDPAMIDECVEPMLRDPSIQMTTVMKRIESGHHDTTVVKVVRDLSGRALYFSRSLLPYPQNRTADFRVFEHIGLYAYTRECLLRLAKLTPTPLEKIESLEQLRALEHGIPIHVVETRCEGELVSVDTQEDLEKVRAILAARQSRRNGK